ncbi:MAG: TetR/AcrR family transcriptional regulator [Candidatus Omnitrophica bacterium]|nr:TetR/AcrR family transcriptional regulator [Candidatus Omnitrophota bacterium]
MRIADRAKRKELTQIRQTQILDAASEIFSKKGFAHTQVDGIANLAGLGKGTIYRYFKDKKKLFSAVVDRGLEDLKNTILIEVDKIEDPLKKIETVMRTYLSFFERNSDLTGVLIHEQSSFQKRIAERYFEHYYGNVDKMKQIFKEAIGKGIIKDINIDNAISVLAGLLNGLIYMWQIENRSYKLSDKLSIVSKIFFTGIIRNEKRRKEYE